MKAGQTVHLRFNRAPTTHCADPLAQYPGSNYTVFLYNNPVRNLDTIHFDAQIKIAGDIPESVGAVAVKIPKDLPQVQDGTVWYLRLGTTLATAPQVSLCLRCAAVFTGVMVLDFLFHNGLN